MEEFLAPEPTGNLRDYEAAYKEFNWASMESFFDWSKGGPYNVAAEALDRHATGAKADKVALFSISPTAEVREFSFGEMARLSNRFASGLMEMGAKRGDRIFIFLDRRPELFVAFLGIAKMGGIAGPLFSALGPEAVRDRVQDAKASIVITSPYLYKRLEPVMAELGDVQKFIIVGDETHGRRSVTFQDVLSRGKDDFRAAPMNPEDPYIIHYTSGSTGKPKGILLGHKAMLQQAMAVRYTVDLKENDIYWCTADPGWVTGTSIGILAPWYMGVSIISFEGRFDPKAWYSILADLKVSVWFTAPTALRMLMRAGDEVVKEHDLSALRHICSAGEPLNPEVIRWGSRVLGMRIHDNWWQTETGAPCISNFKTMKIKPGSMGKPLPGVVAAIVDEHGEQLPPKREGFLALRPGWPAMMVGIWNNPVKHKEYFRIPGWYASGDQAYKDEEGYIWFLGRADDVIKTSGERLGPFEVESALIEHPAVAESAVIGKPDELRGEIVKAFIVLRPGFTPSEQLKEEISQFVRTRLAYYAYPREIEFLASLPKTRSGKIMRRVLKAKELGHPLGDTSTMED
jgi:acetyl-CoA synthetase